MPPLPTAHQNPTETKTYIKNLKKNKKPQINLEQTQSKPRQLLSKISTKIPLENIHTELLSKTQINPDQNTIHKTQILKKTHLLSKPQIIADQNTTHIAPLPLDQHSHRCR